MKNMMKTIYKSKTTIVKYSKDNNRFELNLSHSHHQINDFKRELQDFIGLVEEYRPVKILWNLQEFDVAIEPSLQAWIDSNINAKEVELGVKKEAFLMPEEFITQISVEQTMDEENAEKIECEFFKHNDDAISWLLND